MQIFRFKNLTTFWGGGGRKKRPVYKEQQAKSECYLFTYAFSVLGIHAVVMRSINIRFLLHILCISFSRFYCAFRMSVCLSVFRTDNPPSSINAKRALYDEATK